MSRARATRRAAPSSCSWSSPMALVAFGVVMVYSASSSFTLLEHHAVYAALGLAALWLLARRDYRHIAALAPAMLVSRPCCCCSCSPRASSATARSAG